MGRKPHRNEFITDATKRKKQYKQRMVTMMRKRYELEVMCGAKIQITFIRGESSSPNLDPCDEPTEDDYDYDMHGATWYQDTKPKSTKEYYNRTQKKLKLQQLGNTGFAKNMAFEQTYSQAILSPRTQMGFHQQSPLSAVAATATWFKPQAVQSDMNQLTNDDAFSQLFPTPSVPVSQVTYSPKKNHDDFFDQQYKDMFASNKGAASMFGSANNNMFAPASPSLFKPPSPPREYASLLTTQPSRKSLLGYSPTYNSAQITDSLRLPFPRPEYKNLQLLGYVSEEVPTRSSISKYNNPTFFGTSPRDNFAKVTPPNPTLSPRADYGSLPPPHLLLGTGFAHNSAPNPTLSPRADYGGLSPQHLLLGTGFAHNSAPSDTPGQVTNYEGLPPSHSLSGISSAQNHTLSSRPDFGDEVPLHVFFGTSHKYDLSHNFEFLVLPLEVVFVRECSCFT